MEAGLHPAYNTRHTTAYCTHEHTKPTNSITVALLPKSKTRTSLVEKRTNTNQQP